MSQPRKVLLFLPCLLFIPVLYFHTWAQSDDYYNNALDLFEQQNFTGAIEMLQKEIKNNPKNARGYELTSGAYAALGNLKEAEKWFHKAVELDPKNSRIYWNWGLHVLDRDCEEGKKYFDKAMELKPGDVRGATGAYRSLALCYEKLSEIDKAEMYYLKTLEIDPSDESAWSMIKSSPQLSGKITPERIQKLHAQYLKSEEERKKKVLEEAGKQKGKSAEYHALGLEYFNKGEYEAAIRMWKKEIEAGPENLSWPYFDIGLCYSSLGKYNEAIPYYHKSLKFGFPADRVHKMLTQAYKELKPEQVRESLMRLLKSNYYDSFTLSLLKTYAKSANIPESVFKKFQKEYDRRKAEIEERTRRIDEQTQRALQEPFYIAYFEEILLVLIVLALVSFLYFKPWYSYYIYAGSQYYRAQNYEKAAMFYEKLFAHKHGSRIPYDRLKQVYLKLGRKDEKAVLVFEKIYKENPEDKEVIMALANAYAKEET